MKLNIHVDAISRGSAGPAAAGVVIGVEDPPELLHEAGYFLGSISENMSEYRGLIQALQIAVKIKGVEEVCIYSDSEVLVKQITGSYRVKAADLVLVHEETQMMLLRLDLWQIKQVNPEETRRAEELVAAALELGKDVVLKEIGQSGPSKPMPALEKSASLPTEARPAEAKTWRVTLSGKPCAFVKDAVGAGYTFGATTPAGLCVHAADAVFDCNPLGQLDEMQPRLTSACAQCGATIKAEIVRKPATP